MKEELRAKGAVVSQRWLSQCSAYLASSGRAGSAQAMREHILDLFLTADLYHCCDSSDLLPSENEVRRSSADAPVLCTDPNLCSALCCVPMLTVLFSMYLCVPL
jgi:hypothetical protein